MTEKERRASEAEALVRRILVEDFKQQVDEDTVHEVAEKVSRAVPLKAEAIAS